MATAAGEASDGPSPVEQLAIAVRQISVAGRASEVVDALRCAARSLCGARGVTVVARDGDQCHYLIDDSESALWSDQRFPLESCISGWTMLNGAAAVVPDIFDDPRIPLHLYAPTFVRSLVMTPMGREPPFGAFGAYWDERRVPSAGEVATLGALGACAASALQRLWRAHRAEAPAEPLARTEERPHLLHELLRREAEDTLRQREAELMEAHRRLNAIVDNATVAIFLMDEKQHCAYMNAAAEKLTGYTLAETVGRPLHDVVHHTRPDGSHFPLEECPIDRAFPERAQMQGEEIFVHKDGGFYPVAFTASPILDDHSQTIGTIIEVQDIRARRAAEAQQELLMREVDHRSRNVLAVVQSLVRLTNADDPGAFKRVIAGRVDALARAQASLAAANWQGASLAAVLQREVGSMTALDRIVLQGEELTLGADQVQPLSMIIHELATNAVKYGALSAPTGRVTLRWRAQAGRLVELRWEEAGGPPVERREREGFGSNLIARLSRQLEARIETEWRREGLQVTLSLDAPPGAASPKV